MFDSHEWLSSPSGVECKVFCYDSFKDHDLSPVVEYTEKYSDIHYAMSVFRKMGYRVLLGGLQVCVYKNK